jgi:hypothetical protein
MTQQSVAEAYRLKLASNPEGVDEPLKTWEIYHPLMSKRYYLVNDMVDLTAYLEDGTTQVTFTAAKISTKNAANNADMNQSATLTAADVDNTLDAELDLIPLDSTILPTLIYREYLPTDLSYPAIGPIEYEAQDINQGKGTFTAEVSSPKLNSRGTGLILTPDLCPLIRGLLA